MIDHPDIHYELALLRQRELERFAARRSWDEEREPRREVPSLRASLSRLAFKLSGIPAPAHQASGC